MFNDVELRTTRIGKELDLTNARIAGKLNMERMAATGGVFIGEERRLKDQSISHLVTATRSKLRAGPFIATLI